MGISLNISSSSEQILRDAAGTNVERYVLESVVIEGYRSGKFGAGQVRQLLDLPTRMDAEAWLASRGVERNYSLKELEDDRRAIHTLFGIQL